MSTDNLFDSIKENLNGRPGQPIVFGVCNALAKRLNTETWVTRAAAIVLGVFWTFPTLVAYILLGVFLPETEERTKGVFQGLFISLREMVDRFVDAGSDLFGSNGGRDGARR